jgi:hypothetical protein
LIALLASELPNGIAQRQREYEQNASPTASTSRKPSTSHQWWSRCPPEPLLGRLSYPKHHLTASLLPLPFYALFAPKIYHLDKIFEEVV